MFNLFKKKTVIQKPSVVESKSTQESLLIEENDFPINGNLTWFKDKDNPYIVVRLFFIGDSFHWFRTLDNIVNLSNDNIATETRWNILKNPTTSEYIHSEHILHGDFVQRFKKIDNKEEILALEANFQLSTKSFKEKCLEHKNLIIRRNIEIAKNKYQDFINNTNMNTKIEYRPQIGSPRIELKLSVQKNVSPEKIQEIEKKLTKRFDKIES